MKRTIGNRTNRTAALASLALAMSVTLAACGGGEEEPESGSESSEPADDATSESPEEPTESESSEAPEAAEENFGPACADVPADGAGSFEGMAQDPVATAASNNPALSTLVSAVGEAELVETLNGLENATVFAPANSAFEKIPEADLNAVLADKDLLTKILTHHVIGDQRLAPEDLAGEQTTVNGDSVTIRGEGEDFRIPPANGGEKATVVCGNVQTANATVYIIDSVLMPEMAR